jgi:hypothetical protein
LTDVSEERIASIFRLEEQYERDSKVEAGGKQSSNLLCFPSPFNLVSCLAYGLTLKMEAI